MNVIVEVDDETMKALERKAEAADMPVEEFVRAHLEFRSADGEVKPPKTPGGE